MNQQTTRTLIFVGIAALCVAGAWATSSANRPATLDDTAQVGEKFFPDFTDPSRATSVRVAVYDSKSEEKVKIFQVEQRNNLWRIPSHNDYPADGAEPLAKTAGSVIGIERGAYSGKTPDDHKRLGVLDPLDASIKDTEGRGNRITLTEGDKVAVDFIIGKPVPDVENTYYVRRADEQRVYRARLDNFQVSTKFADWIEQDLLKVQSSKITDLIINRYRVDESRMAIVPGEVDHLLKDDKNTWTMEGLDPETEKLNTSTISSMTFALQDLKIVGVRPKPPGLSAALRREEGAQFTQFDVIEMKDKGFYLAGEGELVSNEGEIRAGTNEGVRYTLRFGKVFTGSDIEIEAGKPRSEADENAAAAPENAESGATDAVADDMELDETDESLKRSRYVLIRASFDESLLGPRPEAPVKPEPPPEAAAPADKDAAAAPADKDAAAAPADKDAAAAPADKDAAAAPADKDAAADEATPDKPAEGASPGDATDATQPEKTDAAAPDAAAAQPQPDSDEPKPDDAAEPKPEEKKPDPQAEYAAALAKYNADQAQFEQKTRDYDEKVEKGKKLAQELDLRFANWYYVIDAAQFDKLRVQRSDLVEPKEPPKTTTPEADAATPGAAATTPPPPPASEPATTPQPDADAKPEADAGESAPAADDAKPDGDAPPVEKPEGDAKETAADGNPPADASP